MSLSDIYEQEQIFFVAQTIINVFEKPSVFFTNESYSDYVLESYKMYDECKLTKTCDQKCELCIEFLVVYAEQIKINKKKNNGVRQKLMLSTE